MGLFAVCLAYVYLALPLFLRSLSGFSAVMMRLCQVDGDFGLNTQIGVGFFFSYDKVTNQKTPITPHHSYNYAHIDVLYFQTPHSLIVVDIVSLR